MVVTYLFHTDFFHFCHNNTMILAIILVTIVNLKHDKMKILEVVKAYQNLL